jgi:hypothetical protein
VDLLSVRKLSHRVFGTCLSSRRKLQPRANEAMHQMLGPRVEHFGQRKNTGSILASLLGDARTITCASSRKSTPIPRKGTLRFFTATWQCHAFIVISFPCRKNTLKPEDKEGVASPLLHAHLRSSSCIPSPGRYRVPVRLVLTRHILGLKSSSLSSTRLAGCPTRRLPRLVPVVEAGKDFVQKCKDIAAAGLSRRLRHAGFQTASGSWQGGRC